LIISVANQNSPFEHAALEADMKRLAEEIGNHRDRPEMKNTPEKELLKEAIRAFPRLEKDLPAVSVPISQLQNNGQSPLPDYAKDASPEMKLEIEYLLDLALYQGLAKALIEADKSPYFVRDAFHDVLAGKLYPELQKRGIIK
jgi:hypothetical protein